jgi:protein gp37
MAEVTKIAWCDHTFSPWVGCAYIHTGCDNCYAEKMAGRLGVAWGTGGTRRRTAESSWRRMLSWDRAAARAGERRRVFPSLCDPFEDRPELVRWRRDFFTLIDRTPNLDWILLTKRPENARRMWPWNHLPDSPVGTEEQHHRYNVWIVYSASDQQTLKAGLPHLLRCRDLSPVLGLSLEPLIGPIDLKLMTLDKLASGLGMDQAKRMNWNKYNPSWVVCGGESGPRARPCDVAWIRSIIRQCREAGVPCFVKQLGSNVFDADLTSDDDFPDDECWPEGTVVDFHRVILRDPKGGDPSEWPEDLRVRDVSRFQL